MASSYHLSAKTEATIHSTVFYKYGVISVTALQCEPGCYERVQMIMIIMRALEIFLATSGCSLSLDVGTVLLGFA